MSVAPASPPARALSVSLDVFGSSNPLYPLVLHHLPDVLARIVVHYASPLFPRQCQYAGNAMLGCGCHAAFNTRTARLLSSSSATSPRSSDPSSVSTTLSRARPFSLSGALTVCGWMCRPRADKAAVLLSANSNVPQAARPTCMFVGYDKDVHSNEPRLSARFADEPALLAPQSAVLPTAHRGWEHIALTFQPAAVEEKEDMDDDEEDAAEPAAGTRRLFHNGALVAQDECSPLPLHTDFYLLLGRYDMRIASTSAQGGLCDVRVYSRALDADEVQRLYEGEEVSSEQLEVRWRLDVSQCGEEQYVRDSSGHNRHAVVPGHPVEISKTGSPGRDSDAAAHASNQDDGANHAVR